MRPAPFERFAGDGSGGLRAFVIGCGDIGRRVALLERQAGTSVSALARSAESERRLGALGIATVPGDLDNGATLASLPVAGRILYYFAPPPASGHGDPRLDAALAAIDPSRLPAVVVYISTSGVYGDCRGDWVTEAQPLNPQSERARRRAAAERTLRRWSEDSGGAIVILRVPGIYGPGRLPLEAIRSGRPLLREEESPYSNRIHAGDLAAACFLAARRGRAGAAYNASDGHPTTMTDYFNRVADAAGLPRPPQIGMEEARRVLPPALLSFLDESKRLDNRLLLEELGLQLRHPDLASGLAACIAGAGETGFTPHR